MDMNGWMTGWTNRSDTSRVKELPPPTRPHSPQQKLQHSASHLSETARGTKWPEARDTPHNANPVPGELRTMATGRIYNPHPHGGCSKSHSGSFGLISRHHDNHHANGIFLPYSGRDHICSRTPGKAFCRNDTDGLHLMKWPSMCQWQLIATQECSCLRRSFWIIPHCATSTTCSAAGC